MKLKKFKLILLTFLILFLPACLTTKKIIKTVKQTQEKEHYLSAHEFPDPSKPITILVHGTRMPPPVVVMVPGLGRQVTTPPGLYRAADLDMTYLFKRIAKTIAKSDARLFPFENIYLFGWSGILSFEARKQAAEKLYTHIERIKSDARYKNTPITIITISHGGNVALNLGAIANEKANNIEIEKLILLCSPIQDATEQYVNSPVFKNVYHLYSAGEMVQVMDPQGMYDKETMGCKPQQFFSHRFIKNAHSKVVQAEIRYKKRTLCHVDFALPHFTKHLAGIMQLLVDDKKRNILPHNADGAVVLDYIDVP